MLLMSFLFAMSGPAHALLPCGISLGRSWSNSDGSPGGWVANSAKVEAGAYLAPGTRVCDYAQVKAGARLLENAKVTGRAVILADAEISGNAEVQGEAKVGGGGAITKVGGSAVVEGSSMITGSSHIYGRAKVRGGARVHNSPVCQASIVEGVSVTDSDYYCDVDDVEPPHPGEVGNKTLLGVDVDRDGVRDDIEIWINDRFPNTPGTDNYNFRMGFRQFAQGLNEGYKFKDIKDKAMAGRQKALDAAACITGIASGHIKNFDEAAKARKRIREIRKDFTDEFVNAIARLKADEKGASYFHGKLLEASPGTINGCRFELRKK